MKASDTNVHTLLQGTKVFLVPNFQRRYSWKRDQWESLWTDVLREYQRPRDGSGKVSGHFLGSVVLHPAPGPASIVAQYLVIDGQQRLTTLLTLLAAIRDARQALEEDFDPNEYDHQYIFNPFHKNTPHRLVPTTYDRDAYNETIANRAPTGNIGQAYSWFRDKIYKVADEDAVDLGELAHTILVRLVLVEITTGGSDSINSIFNTLNSKGMPLSSADLIRNELLLNIEPDQSDGVHRQYWLPMERKLTKEKAAGGGVDDSKLINYFWTQELRHDGSVAAKDLFPEFERRLRTALSKSADRPGTARAWLERWYQQHDLYAACLDPHHDGGLAAEIPPTLRQHLSALSAWGSAPAVPVQFAIVVGVLEGRYEADDAERALEVLIGYLVRRSLAGIPTNNLNRMLSSVPSYLESNSGPVDYLLSKILSRPGYRWPSDADVLDGVQTTPIYATTKRAQSKFILAAVERHMEPKETVGFDKLSVEHVMPQTINALWIDYLQRIGTSAEAMVALLHTLGNLTLTGYNSELGQDLFVDKRRDYEKSPLKLNRELARTQEWGPDEIRDRSQMIGAVLVRLFRGPSLAAAVSQLQDAETVGSLDGLKTALNSVAEGDWTTAEEIAAALGLQPDAVHRHVNTLGPELARVVRNDLGGSPNWLHPGLADAVARQGARADGRLVNAEELAVAAGWTDVELEAV